MIVGRDPSKLDSHCDIMDKSMFPEFTKGDWDSPNYVVVEGVKIYLPGGKKDLGILARVAEIYGIDPSSISVRIKKKAR